MYTRFQGNTTCARGTTAPIGILLTNLGTPEAPTPKALRRYLAEFLWDPRVVEIPRPIWWLILKLFVLPLRPKRSAKLYQKIWMPDGSPLLINMQQLVDKIAQQFEGDAVKVALGMRYGKPSITAGLEELRKAHVQKIFILPLYPQYAGATTGSVFDAVSAVLKTWRWVPELRLLNHYADHPSYIAALVETVKAHWQQTGQRRHLLFSFHGVPKRSHVAGDPYYCYCHKTARLVAEQLGLTKSEWTLAFQSRFGKAEWLQPYCDKTLEGMPGLGITEVDVICPGFSVDCLETLEEIAMQNHELFMQAGGKSFHYIPALNASAQQVKLVSELIRQHTQGW